MTIDTNTMVSISDANKSFSNVARIVEQYGSAVILKNNTPKYIVVEFNSANSGNEASDAELFAVSSMVMKRNSKAYQELAK
ncbi:MAG: type II toxin-antitoxin system Phd/YefM family antitoxin [Spirochaetales bacterium]|nr:type II toxin-antitoxin system Phd/YefM family antitoxin [Spirochaetales bacterium]MBR1582984.1 type II toxin-antitoxin system Phd/YefM family antitoxin [Spirochaetales bacterium]